MTFTLDRVVPWGRDLEEYRRMFALEERETASRILGCADGPASFNAELTAVGGRVISVDPLYRFGIDAIRRRVVETSKTILAETQRNRHEFVWSYFEDIAALERTRLGAMGRFLEDFPLGLKTGRYRVAELPQVPFADDSFDLALSSHFLFLYSEQLGLEFHLASLREMLRLAVEVRVFPLLQLGSQPSALVGPVLEALRGDGHAATIEPVDYEFQRGGSRMLRVRRAAVGIRRAAVD